MDKIKIRKDSRIVFIGDSITDVKFNSRFRFKFRVKNIYATQLKKKFRKYSKKINKPDTLFIIAFPTSAGS